MKTATALFDDSSGREYTTKVEVVSAANAGALTRELNRAIEKLEKEGYTIANIATITNRNSSEWVQVTGRKERE